MGSIDPGLLKIEATVDRDGRVTLTLLGELDSATAPDLDAALSLAFGQARDAVTVDIAPLQFIGAAGFHALERGQEVAQHRGLAFMVLADAWKIRIAKLVETRPLNIELAPDDSGSTMWLAAGALAYALAA